MRPLKEKERRKGGGGVKGEERVSDHEDEWTTATARGRDERWERGRCTQSD